MDPDRLLEPGIGGSSGWGSPPLFPLMPHMSADRIERWHRIGPILPALKEGFIPLDIPVNLLENLLVDIKEEGNACFKDKDYNGAYEMYTSALHVCKNLQTVHFVSIDKELLSTIFSNRAACLLKMDFYKESIQDCEIAIQQNCDNIKAHYRMGVAYKSLREYSSALQSAMKGRQQASNAKKIKEVKEFDDLIREVESHMPSPENVAADKSNEMSKLSSIGKVVENSGKNYLQKPLLKTDVTNDFKIVHSKMKDNRKMDEKDISKVDNRSWVKEKPAIVKKKAENIAKKKVKKKVIQKKSQYQGKYAMLSNDGSNSDESDGTAELEEEDEDIDDANNSESVDYSNLPTEMAMGLDDFHDIPSHASGRREVNVHEVSNNLSTLLHRGSGDINKQNDYPFTTASYQQPVAKVTNQSQQNSFHGDFICLSTKLSNEFPFLGNYDITLACDQCYLQTGFGQAGYQCLGMLPHKCDYNVFLIRPKLNPAVGWIKIRPRNQKVKFHGPFRICWEYSSGQRCRVTEKDCSFAHSDEECRLWTLDRENQFDLTLFVSNLRLSTNRSSERSLDMQQQQQYGKTFTNSAYGQSMDNDALFLQGQKDAAQKRLEHKNIPEVNTFGRKMTSMGFESIFSNVLPDSHVQQDLKMRLGPEPISWAKAAAGREQIGNHQVSQNEEVHQSYRIPFPLAQFCDFRLVCNQCFLPLSQFGDYFWWNPGFRHKCEENILAVQHKGANIWVRIRERINHRDFRGSYVLCRHYESGKPNACRREENCLFAHNYEEQHLWTMEKDGSFDIAEFIGQNRSQSAAPLFSVYGMLEKYPGELRHLCSACYRGSHLLSGQSNVDAMKCSCGQHLWQENKMLIHFSASGVITEIGQRAFRSKNAYFKLCHHQKFCYMKNNGKCKYAHSLIERDVWCLERDQDLTEDQIVEEAMKINSQKYLAGLPKPGPLDEQKQLAATSDRTVPVPVPVPLSEQQVPSEANSSTKCPYRVIEVCKLCFEKGAISRCKKDRCDGPGMGHIWSQNKLCLILPSKKKLSPLPRVIPRNLNFVICRHMLQKKKCDFVPGGQCQFAHSKEEIEVWTWMVRNNARTLDELLLACQKTYLTSEAKTISKGQSVIAINRSVPTALPQPKPYASPLDLAMNTNYCHYCSVHCNSQKQWDEHCASDKHMFNVNSDKEHQWNYRQPPWGIGGCNYELCDKHADGGKCSFSEVPDMYNQCKFAHSREELDEWKERWEWRQMKREIAKKEHLYSYMAALREDYETTDAGITVISDEIEGVFVKCSSSLNIFEQKKNTAHSWFFEIHAGKRKLHKVALLYDRDRLHFTLHGANIEKDCQIAPGESFITSNSVTSNLYNVEVRFSSGIFGSFSQWVIFDFNERPVLVRMVNAELGTQFVQEKVKALREKLKFDRWTSDNREIVWFDDRTKDTSDLNNEILQCYKAPSSADSVVTQQTVGVELNRHNYVHKMHKLLQIEELTQAHIMSRFNLQVEIKLMQRIVENGFVNARSGELFACVPLSDHLNEDTDAGCLILSGVSTVLLAPLERSDRIVYEAIFVQKENFDYNGRGSDHVYLCLSARCCEALKLRNDDSVEVEIQFQLNRLTFCQMHYAVDQLPSTDIVFPDISRVSQTSDEESLCKPSSSVLNEDQLKIVEYIVAPKQGYNPPLVIYGPFGTGKTETLAQAAMTLSSVENSARILICTHSNSAADLYILRHFDAFIKQSCPSLKVLRIYAKERRTNTVKPLVQKYSLMSDDRSSFLEPTRTDVLDHKVVITTLVTSLTLTRKLLNLRGYFSHIFIDEAAQVFECETVMPLSLATDSTTIVLAGDYNQMAQKVYSKEAQRQRFHRSLVHRLFEHYKTYAHVAGSSLPNILLKSNYRTKMEILRFLAAVFYGGPDRLIACSNQLPIDDVVPLSFYTAFGREIQDHDSTSYYNMAEIEEVVERVSELYNNWPKDWNEPVAESILVVTPYLDQVLKIRSALKKKSRELGRLSVDRVSNVQGTEFRAVFISTVRTQHLAEVLPRMPANASECDGEFGDFGFLSDQRLLNTAFTRARSLVAVVGDPVALCAIGECMTVWRTYLKHCQNMKSIHPSSVTLDTVKARVQSLLNSPVCGPNLQSLSVLHQEAASGKLKSDKRAESDLDTEFSALKPDPNPFESITLKGVFEDWSLDYQIEPSSIIEHLMKEVVLQKSGEHPKRIEKQGEHSRLECTQLVEKRGRAMIQFTSGGSNEVMKAGDNSRGYESGGSDDDSNMQTAVYVDYMPQQLKEMLCRQPERFKHCVLKVENSQSMYARLLHSAGPYKQIKISSRSRCGQAFGNDEAVVEIFPDDAEDAAALPEDQKQIPCGQVIGILKQAINPKHHMFVCMVEEDNTGCMIPINRSIPKIYNLEQRTKEGHVCVYTFTRDKDPVFHHYEPIDSLNPCSKLFIVRYLKWEMKFSAPLGIVVGVLPAGVTVEQTMRILKVEHYIPTQFKEDTVKEVKELFPASYQFPSSELSDRLDYRKQLTFTVDSLNSKYLDNAISIEDLSNACFLIGVHVSDVSYFVTKGGCIDNEAEKRGLTVHPFACDPVQMLPDRLSSDLCSLLPGKDRLTLSVFITIDAKASIQKVQIKRSVICSKYHLDYARLEAVIKHRSLNSTAQDLPENVCLNALMLNRVAQIWRRRRLGTAAMYHDMQSSSVDSAEAHVMIEELVITANHHVARQLIKKYPLVTPLFCQLPPGALELDAWRQKFIEEAKNTVALTQPFKDKGDICNCMVDCKCIPETTEDLVLIDIRKSTWEDIKNAVVDDDFDRLTSLIICPENHPQMALAMLKLNNITSQSQYVCSGDVPQDQQAHNSLNVSFYTHFTSPTRRYMDIVVHRLIRSCLDERHNQYSQSEIAALCNSCTEVALNAHHYEEATEMLHYAKVFKDRPAVLFPIIEKLGDELQLRFPLPKVLLPLQSIIKLSSLKVCEKSLSEENKQLKLKWSIRIYDLKAKIEQPSKTSSMDAAVLNGNQYILQTTASDWRELLWSIVSSDKDKILTCLMQVDELLVDSSQDDQFASDVTSEGSLISSGQQFSDFCLTLYAGSVVQVQVTCDLVKGMMVPSIQLFNLTPTLNICLEHRVNAVKCFTETATHLTTKKSYRSVETYLAAWLPVLTMEAARNAVLNDDSVVIHNVEISWQAQTVPAGKAFCGTFHIPIHVCKSRQLKFKITKENGIDENVKENNDSFQLCHGYLCVQYQKILFDKPNLEPQVGKGNDLSAMPATWVGHCTVLNVGLSPDKHYYTIEVHLHQSSCPIPSEILQPSIPQMPIAATVEWIFKPPLFRRMQDAVFGLRNSDQLSVNIALGKNPQHLDDAYLSTVDQLEPFEMSCFPVLNQVQEEAINQALHQPFTPIQGPPGTGKTRVGVQLAYRFALINRKLPSTYKVNSIHPQILCCGPSDKSVNILARYLLQLKEQCPKLVRVYSKSVERDEFPLPHDLVQQKKRLNTDTVSDDLKSISLHHKIRNGGCVSDFILKTDKQIRADPNSVNFKDVENYLEAIAKAEMEAFKEAEIILCTCSTGGGLRVKNGTNIQQLIIDDSGLCMEPEALISVVGSKAKQVILLGDHHNQVQPTVLENSSCNRGLGPSLFERYADKAIRLTTQYRMHESIAEFPSKFFYNDCLTFGKDDQTKASPLKFWPNDRRRPVAFVHVMGVEQALTVVTANGIEHSQSNSKEVDTTVRIANLLVRRFHVLPQCVAVLSQYHAQCMEIEKELLKRGEKDITVSTVAAAQGSEWDFVILSTVRSLPKSSIEKKPTKGWKYRNLGLITDTQQTNIALTRARKGFIIIGNKYLLRCDKIWKKLLHHYDAEKKIIDVAEFMA